MSASQTWECIHVDDAVSTRLDVNDDVNTNQVQPELLTYSIVYLTQVLFTWLLHHNLSVLGIQLQKDWESNFLFKKRSSW